MHIYKGWTITYSSTRPVTGTYKAERFGVTMSAASREALERMINQRLRDYPPNGD